SQVRQTTAALEQTLSRREATLTERQSAIERLERELTPRDRTVADREKTSAAAAAKYERLVAQQQHELERVASLTAEEAKDLLLKKTERQGRNEGGNLVKGVDAEARGPASGRAKHYITEAIQRCAADHAIETTVSVVD